MDESVVVERVGHGVENDIMTILKVLNDGVVVSAEECPSLDLGDQVE